MIYPKTFETKIGFSKIRNILKTKCISTLGSTKVDDMSFSTNFDFIQTSLLRTEEFKNICLFRNDFPTSYYFDTTEYFKKVQLDGAFFTTEELFEIKRSLETIKSILSFFQKDNENKYPELKKLAGEVQFFQLILDKISSIIDKFGNILDNASPELLSIRRNLSSKQSNVSKVMHKLLRQAKTDGWVDSDSELTVRDGKMLIPISTAYKRKVKGFILDESESGKTSYIEPIEIVEVNNEIRELEFAERREIIRILVQTTAFLQPYFFDLQNSYDFLAEIDFIRAKASFSIDIQAEKPSLVNKPIVDFRIAKHPLLFLATKNTEKTVIPADIELNENQRIILISGPNAGGKSVCLQTTGLLQYMVQCGLLISANRTSQAGIFENIFIDIGDEQSIENDLSTYSSHLKNMKHFIENSDENTLILIDEFGTGTEPELGGAIAEAVLEDLNQTRIKGIITTHYANLKKTAASVSGIVNAAMLYDTKNMQPLYRLEVGHPGSSFALEIAEKTGLSKRIIDKAKSKVNTEYINFEKLLSQTREEKTLLEQNNSKIQQLEQKLESTINYYNKELEFTLQQRKNILNISKEQAKEILATANKKIENTIFEIKRNNADKDITKQLRKDLEDYIHENEEKKKIEENKINEKIEKIKQREENKKIGKPEIKIKKIEPEIKKIKINDVVRIKGQSTLGKVLEIKGNKSFVAFGHLQMTVDLKKLEFASEAEQKQFLKNNKGGIKVTRTEDNVSKDQFIFGLDVRGKRGDEALQTVMIYIDDAVSVEASEVKILHGTGNGILKQLIRDFLKTNPYVISAKDDRVESGGAGITVVKLNV